MPHYDYIAARELSIGLSMFTKKSEVGFIHGNKKRKHSCTFSDKVKHMIIMLYK